MQKLDILEQMLQYEITKIQRKQKTLLETDSLRFKTIQDVMLELDVGETLDYIDKMYYFWKINEINRYLMAIKQMKEDKS